jgi:malonyl CoA-acyl carrier protein transacylase
MKAFLFPGQGSQRIGMGKGLFEAFPGLTAAADAILGYSIADLCLEDPDRRLGQTAYTQCALYVVNALSHRKHAQVTGERASFAAGHSLGEYNALEYAGAMSFEDGLRLVQKRGALMAAAPKGTMAAVIGIPAESIRDILDENGLAALDVANFNAPTQTIISGPEADLRRAHGVFEKHNAMFVPLNVSGAFHSRYMQAARDAFAAFIAEFRFSTPAIPVIANIAGEPYRAGEIAGSLTDQITHPVRWRDSMEYLLRAGVTDFVELGPGDVLTKLARTIRSTFDPKAAAPASGAPNTAAAPAPPAKTAHEKVADWNRSHSVGTAVKVNGYGETLTTRTPAVVLFGHRAAVYMQGYNGYFALDEVEPATLTRA